MMKKIIYFLVAAVIAGNLAVMPVSADEAAYPDYVPGGEIPENMLLTDQGANTSVPRNFRAGAKATDSTKIGFAIVDTADWVGEAKNYREQKITAKADINTNSKYGYEGVYMSTENDFFKAMERMAPSKSYVISFTAKSVGKSAANIGIAVSNGTEETVSYSADYGYNGIPVSDEYQVVGTAIKTSENFNPEDVNVITIGFPDGTEKDTEVYFTFEDINSIYFGEEIPYDISNVLVSEEHEICIEEEFVMKASVLNQAGTPGCLEQDFTWIAMDKDKTHEVEGFTFTAKEDGTTGVYASADVEEGEYALVAVSDTYEGFSKTAYIELKPKRIADSPLEGDSDEPENMLVNPSNVGQYKNTTSVSVTKGSEFWTVKANSAVENENSAYIEGLEVFTLAAFNMGFGEDFEAGKTYCVKAKVRKSEESTAEDVKFAVSLGQGGDDTYSQTEQISLTDEWEEVVGMLTVSENCTEGIATKKFTMGMPVGTEAGSAFDIQISSILVVPEVLGGSKIEITDAAMPLQIGDEITVKAAIVNQFGIAMDDYSQEFDWYVLNELRNDYVEEIKLNINEESNEANIIIDEFIESGVYYIVAEQKDGDNVIRESTEITVETPVLWEYIRELTENSDKDKISENIIEYAKALGISGVSAEDCDADTAVEILFNNVTEKIESEEELLKQLKRALAISLFVENPNNVSLDVEAEIGIEDIDKDGITIAKLFNEYLSEDGKKTLRKELADGDYTSFDDFSKAFAEQVILNTIAEPSVKGTGYVGDVLTEENAEVADIDISSYLSSKYKTEINKKLARNSYTVSTLISAIENYKPESNKGSSSSGSGGSSKVPSSGGLSVAPKIEQTESDNVTKENMIMFEDVSETHWAYSDIYHLRQRGIISGDEKNYFNPDNRLTREQFVKMLCEAFEYPGAQAAGNFSDVEADAWYAPYVNIATEQKLVNGVSDNMFGTGLNITRQDLCVIVYRAMGVSDSISEDMTFNDSEEISDYAKEAVAYLNLYGVISGFEDGSFRPQDNCTRAQAVKILCKILNMKGVAE